MKPVALSVSPDAEKLVGELRSVKTEFDEVFKAYQQADQSSDKLAKPIEALLRKVSIRVRRSEGFLNNLRMTDRLNAATQAARDESPGLLPELAAASKLWAEEMERFIPVAQRFEQLSERACKLAPKVARALIPCFEALKEALTAEAVEAVSALGLERDKAARLLGAAPRVRAVDDRIGRLRRCSMAVTRTGEAWIPLEAIESKF